MSQPTHIDANDDDRFAISPTGHWTDDVGKSEECANCGRPREGKFCPACGQKHLTERLKFGEMLREMFSRLTDLDRGLFHTFIGLLVRPGQVAKDYVCGKQRPYVHPLTFFFIGTAMQMVSLFLCESILVEMLRANIDKSLPAEAKGQLVKMFGENPTLAIAEIYISSIQQAYAYAALFFFCFPFSLSLYFLHRLGRDKFRFSETSVFALYCFGQMLVLTALITPIAIRIGTAPQLLMALGTYFIYPLYTHKDFFRPGWFSRVLTAMATVVSTLLFFSSILLIFLGYLVVTISANNAEVGAGP